ncbi:RNA polymerase sigma factor SigJ [Kocuria sabuli]|uniref:RNA polymerase sigma factor SigJ n=1 Tax=Kocuria sabuli TaxID=3071448 RepID=UPI0034D590AF
MDSKEYEDDAALVNTERRRLVALAYRMLGTVGEAEDAVQEAFLRWYRLDEAERADIANPAGWLTRVTSRICLDMLGTARARRERYVGQWLPEPVPSAAFAGTGSADIAAVTSAGLDDPLARVTLDDSVSTALLIVLEAMTPAERVAFILHDVFAYPFDDVADIVGRSPTALRQPASSARRRIRSQRTHPVDLTEHARVVQAFGNACQTGDLTALMTVLDPRVSLRSDGGGAVRAAPNPIEGASKVARFLLGVLAEQSTVRLEPRTTPDGLALGWIRDGEVTGVVNVLVDGDLITRVWVQWNPAKLTCWTRHGTQTSHP